MRDSERDLYEIGEGLNFALKAAPDSTVARLLPTDIILAEKVSLQIFSNLLLLTQLGKPYKEVTAL
jgi:hypothetical protein